MDLLIYKKWSDLVEKYLVFVSGYSQIVLRQLGLKRVHFAFLDSGHKYTDLHHELEYVAARQEAGDIIVCEDGPAGDNLVGITPEGRYYRFAENRSNSSELTGAAFSPDGSTLFVNIQNPGFTMAITGPWQRS